MPRKKKLLITLIIIIPAFGLKIKSTFAYLYVFSPNARKYGPEKTPYLDTFHAVSHFSITKNNSVSF